MRIGISISSSHKVVDPREGARNMVERARAANQAGLDTMFIGDHHVMPNPYYQNSPMLGRMLAEWNNKPFGALYLLPLWHPVLLAEQIGTLASIAPGRFIMQCGLGDRKQGAAMGIDMTQRVGMFEAGLEIMRALWRGEKVSEDRYWNLSDARISPVPAEPVEVWVGALVPAAIRRTARMAEGWLGAPNLTPDEAAEAAHQYREACAEVSRTPTAVALRRDIYIGTTSQDARAVVEPYIEAGYREISPDALMFGSVAEVADQINRFGELGYTDMCVRNISTNQSEALATIERLTDVKALLT
ncbi:MAG: LLM class flavin-dependent oxidoreductase [Proteobacteria bacterium]|jgi:alkanesulfonate monooxygenase SsuD/methylene tetrahydromethanopterin reductase-like flavin-dependent oxidoreductase (luciferase family)|nr:LLM class flavin-dependent oxidoreductase [Pseudomonadota bacterium]